MISHTVCSRSVWDTDGQSPGKRFKKTETLTQKKCFLIKPVGKRAGEVLQGLAASGCEDDLRVFSDAGFAGASTKSQSGLAIIWGGSLITWRSSQAALSALSTAEAEFVALVKGVCETKGIASIMRDLTGVETGVISTYADASAAIGIVQRKAT